MTPNSEEPDSRPTATQGPQGLSDFVAFIHDWGHPEWVLLAVEARIDQVTDAYARLCDVSEPALRVEIRSATEKDDEIAPLVVVLQLSNSPWCIILRHLCSPLDLQLVLDATSDARQLSSVLKTKALAFFGADSSSSMGFSLAENGKQAGGREWPQTQARQADKTFADLGLDLPVCYPCTGPDGAWLAVVGSSILRVERADFINLEEGVDEAQTEALLDAVIEDKLSTVRLLLQKGARPTRNVVSKGITRAVWTGDLAVLKLLLEHKPGRSVSFGPSAVSECLTLEDKSLRWRIKVAQFVLAAGADINGNGGEALRKAIAQESPKLVKFLIEAGADINATTPSGSTPLHYAAFLGQVECAELLIQAGAKLDATNDDGKTPAQWAAFHDNKDLAKLLQQWSQSPTSR